MDNKELQKYINIITNKRNLYFIIGFVIATIPFMLLLSIMSYGNYMNQLFKLTIIIMGILTAISNGFILQYKVTKLYEEKLELNYKELKKDYR